MEEKFEVVRVLGYSALFVERQIGDDEVPNGLYRYDLRSEGDDVPFATLEKRVFVNRSGTVLFPFAIEFGNWDFIILDGLSSPHFTGIEMTIERFNEAVRR